MSFWGELKRRNVFKVGAAYLIAAWLILQVASITFPALNLPSWALTLVTVFLIIGFVVALLLAWAFELTPEGVKRSENVPLDESITHVTGRKLNYMLVGLIIVLIGYIVIDKALIGRSSVETEVAPPVAEQAFPAPEVKEEPKTIAVLPFENLSSDPEQEYFVDGLIEEILNSLSKIPDLSVTSRTSAFSFKGTNKTVQEIASVLGVANILEGSVRKAGNTLRVTAQLIRAADDRHLWSNQYDRELKDVEDILSIQEDIAKAVANELEVSLGVGESLKQLGGTENTEAYELFLIAKGKTQGGNIQLFTEALEATDAAIALDPDFALAWALKAKIQNYLSTWVSADLVASKRDAAEQSALKAIELEPDLADGYFPLGVIKQSNGNWIEAEKLFREGMMRTPVSINPEEYGIPNRYWSVGQLAKCHELLEAIRQKDPLNEDRRRNYIWSFSFLGNIQRAEEEYERSKELFGSKWAPGDITICRICAGKFVSIDEMYEYFEAISPGIDVRNFFRSPEEMLAWLRQFEEDDLSSGQFCMESLFSVYYGDPEFALDAMKRGVSLEAQGIFWAWAPVFHEVRQLPRFKELIREIGLVDYWEQFGWPDLCRPLDNGDFVCD